MQKRISRRTALAGGVAALALSSGLQAQAQSKPKFKLSIAFPETDLRAEAYKAFESGHERGFRSRTLLEPTRSSSKVPSW